MMKTLDLRKIPVAERKTQLEVLLPTIEPGTDLTLLSDADLRAVFKDLNSSKLTRPLQVREIEAGPDLWMVTVEAIDDKESGGSCCGSCGC